MKTRYTSLLATLFVMAFMYLPIVMLVSQSFNASRYGGRWMGFSLKWYEALFRDSAVINATLNTLIIACVSTLFSTAAARAANCLTLPNLIYASSSSGLVVLRP